MAGKILKQMVQKLTVLTVLRLKSQESMKHLFEDKYVPNCAFAFDGLGKNLFSCIVQILGVQAFIHLPCRENDGGV